MSGGVIGFGLAAATALLLALGTLLRPLLATTTTRPAAAAQAAVAPERGLAAALVLLLPLIALVTYALVGSPRLLLAPRDAAGWRELARGHEAAQHYDEAVAAYRQALALQPDDPALLVDFAVTLAMQNGQHLAGEPARLIQRALQLAPQHTQALALTGSLRFEAEDYRGAIQAWREVQARLPADAAEAGALAQSLARAEALVNGQVTETAPR